MVLDRIGANVTVRGRFEFAKGRHRPEAEAPRAAADRWRGRAIGDYGVKRHIMRVGHVVDPDDIPKFMFRAEKTLREMGGSDLEVKLALDHARVFLNSHARKRSPIDPRIAGWASVLLARQKGGGRRDR